MLIDSLKICTAGRKAMYDLVDNTPYRVRNVKESLSINEITTLSFELPIENFKWKHIRNEELILFKKEYYRIKNANFIHDEEGKLYVHVECKHYSDNLANDLISIAETTPKNVIDLMKVALCYDADGNPTKGWSVGKVTVTLIEKAQGGETPENPETPETPEAKDITVKAKVPAAWTNTITAWVWPTGGEGQEVVPTKQGDWYVYTHNCAELNIIFKNGEGWTGDANQTVDMKFTENACIVLEAGEGKATYTNVDCE